MKDSKFIELLNLYVDHQISAADAALLEAEIQHDPERRRVYRQYCQMQKACAMLADNFRTEAPARGKMVAFPSRGSRLRAAVYAVGAVAAAACVALVAVSRNQQNAGAAPALAATSPEVGLRASAPTSRDSALPAPARAALQPAFTAVLRDGAPNAMALGASERVPLDWMRTVQLERVPATQTLWFETRPTIQPQDLSFPTRQNGEVQAEMTAFRFQR